MSEMSMAMSSSQNNNEDENAYLDTTEEDVGEDEDEEIEDKYLSIADDDNSKNEFENEDDDNDYDDDELMDYKKPNSSNNNNNNGNTNGKRRTVYDKSNLDTAVDLVLRNKLSLRAASHIYNIPFSSLRTRKIFVENQCASGSKTARKLMGKKTPTIRDIYDIDNNDAEDDAQNCFNNVPFNHNKHAAQPDGSKRQKIDAIRSNELETSNTRSGKPSKIVYSPVMPSTKRLYIKHERLLMMLGARQQQQQQQNTTDHEKLPEKTSSTNTSSTHSNSKLKNEPPSSETTTNTPTAKKSNSPFKLSSILSSTTLSMKNKTQIKQQQQQQQQQQQTPNYNTTKINVLLKLNEASSLSNGGKCQNSSITANQEALQSTPEITPDKQQTPKRTSPFECSRCSLQFVNRAHLNEHENESQCSSTESSTQTLYANVCEISSHEQSKLFKCSFCDCLAYDKLSFLSHTNFCTRKSNSSA